jgi:multidrug efflux pump subunit AcrB
MYSLWKFFIEKRQFSYLVLGVLTVTGLLSVLAIPKESAPEVVIPVGTVTVVLPGASAEDVEQLITAKIEQALLGTLENVDSITSSSRDSASSVTVEFDASADLDKSIQDLKDKVDTVVPDLPEEANDPVVSEVNFVNQPFTTFAIGGNRPAEELSQIAESLDDELSQISGVSDVVLSGAREQEVRVVARPESLAAFNLSLNDIVSGVARANAALPVGSLEIGGVRYPLEFEGDITDPLEIANIPVAQLGAATIYVRDIADVTVGLSRQDSIARVSVAGEPSVPAVTLSVFKRQGGDILAINRMVEERLRELQEPGELLDGLTFLSIYSAANDIGNDLSKLTRTGLETVLLVTLVLFLTVGWRESLVAAVSIPISFVIAFIGLNMSGNTINFVSLFSLILAVGILVDAGIVIVEGMYTQIVKGMSRPEAALHAVRLYQQPLSIGILTTVAVFVPLFFISGVTGEFIATIPFTIIFVLFASLFVALVFVPIIGISALSNHSATDEPTWQDRITLSLQERYRLFLAHVLDTPSLMRKIKWTLIAGFFVSLALPRFGVVNVEFFPGEDSDFVLINVELPQGTPVERTDLTLRIIEEYLYTHPQVASFSVTAGGSSAFSNNPQSGGSLGNFFVNLSENRTDPSSEIVTQFRKDIGSVPGAEIRISEPAAGPPVGTPVVIEFLGDDREVLKRTAGQAAELLKTIEGTANVRSGDTNDTLAIRLSIDRSKAKALGLDPAIVGSILRTAVSGTEATTIRREGDDIDVTVAAALTPSVADPFKTDIANPDALLALLVPTPAGSVPLGTFVTVSVGEGATVINRKEGKRVVTATSELLENGNTAVVVAEFQRRAETELALPTGVAMAMGGENEETNQSFAEMGYAFIGGILLMLAVLMFELNSFRHSFYILSVVPLTMIGIMLGLALTRLPLSFPSLLGIIALAGIIVNHSILLIDSINHLRREHPERSIKDVVIEGAITRLRPINLTNITTVVGMIPLALSGGLFGPLAIAIMFGLLFAGIITLVLVPILYYQKPGSVG